MARKHYPREKQTDKGKVVEPGSLWLGANARQHIDQEALDSLRAQIVEAGGVREQLLIRRRTNPDNPNQHHEVFDGQRRSLAVWQLIKEGHEILFVPARIEPAATTDAEMLMLAATTASGIGKEPLTAVEECRLITMLIGYGFEQGDIAARLGKSQAWVSRRAKLKHTTPAVQREVTEGRMKVGKAEQLAGAPQDVQDKEAAKSKNGDKRAQRAAPKRPGLKAIRKAREQIESSSIGLSNGELEQIDYVLGWAAGEVTDDQMHERYGVEL
jgi:hypothetical protein